MPIEMTFTDGLGFTGVFLILFAYFLNVTDKLKNTDLSFILLNLCGASLACIASVLLNYLPFIILEGIWVLISGNMLFKYLKNK
jgi:hypothetical protein